MTSRARLYGRALEIYIYQSEFLQFKAFIIFNTISFCSDVNGTQLSNNSLRAGVISTISPSAKNCDKVIPKPLHIASNVAIEGTEFLRNILARVDSDNPDSFASLYSVQHLASINLRSFSLISKVPPLFYVNSTVNLKNFIHFTCNFYTVILNCNQNKKSTCFTGAIQTTGERLHCAKK